MNDIEHSLTKAIDLAEEIEVKKGMQQRFERNLQHLKKVAPGVYQKLQSLKPKRYQLGLDRKKQLNLFDLDTKTMLYPDGSQNFCQEQVEAYCRNPLYCQRSFKELTYNDFFNEFFVIAKYLNQITEKSKALEAEYKGNINLPVGLAMVAGVGLGYHITNLINKIEINHLCLYEDNYEIFYLSLYTTDWTKIFDQFTSPGKRLSLFIGRSNDEYFFGTQDYITVHGLHLLANCIYYNHLKSDKYLQFFDKIQKNFHLIGMGFGSFEDELISLHHSVTNFKGHYPILKDIQPATAENIPVFIVANGPSLDYSLTHIKQKAEEAIVISCGTALKPLLCQGIVPDLHIEIERTTMTTQALKEIGQDPLLKQIKIIAHNNVPPSTLELFKSAYLCLKSNDAGATLFESLCEDNFYQLKYASPTVLNGALEIAIILGFKNLHLFGADLAVIDEQHHAKDSIYYDKQSSLFSHQEIYDIEDVTKDNQKIKTSAILKQANVYIQQMLDYYPNIEIHNYSQGAFIPGCQHHNIEAIEQLSLSNINKKAIIDGILKKSMQPTAVAIHDNCHQYLHQLEAWIENNERDILEIIIPQDEIMGTWSLLIENITRGESLSALDIRLIQSSINLFGLAIIHYLYACNDSSTEDYKHHYLEVMSIFKNYLTDIRSYISQDENEITFQAKISNYG